MHQFSIHVVSCFINAGKLMKALVYHTALSFAQNNSVGHCDFVHSDNLKLQT